MLRWRGRAPARPGDRTQAAAGGGGPMTEPASAEGDGEAGRSADAKAAGGRLRRGLEVLRRGARREPRHVEHPAGNHEPGRAERLWQDDADEPDDRPDLPRPAASACAGSPRAIADADDGIRHAQCDTAPRGQPGSRSSPPGCFFSDTGDQAEAKGVEGARAPGSDRCGEPQSRGVFQGHAAAGAAGAGHRARSRPAGAGRAAERPRPAGSRGDDRPVPLLGRREARHPLEPRPPGGGRDQRPGRADRQRDDHRRGRSARCATRSGTSQPIHRPVPRPGRIRRRGAAVR